MPTVVNIAEREGWELKLVIKTGDIVKIIHRIKPKREFLSEFQ